MVGLGASAASSRSVSTTARKRYEPSRGWITQLFLPIQPSPARAAKAALEHGAGVDVAARAHRTLRRSGAQPGLEGAHAVEQHLVVVLAARVASHAGAPGRGSRRASGS